MSIIANQSLAYADDLVLVAPTASAMRKMLAICDEYAREFDISFNPSKSKWLVVVPRRRERLLRDYLLAGTCSFCAGGSYMENVVSYTHLGHIISNKLHDDAADIDKRTQDFVKQFNNMSCYFNKLDVFVRNRLFQSYCSSFYGSVLWLLSTGGLEKLCTAWRKALRVVWRLPYRTHGDLLPLISNCLPIYDELCKRFLNFSRSCLSSQSQLVSFVTSHSIFYAPYSFQFQNLYSCCHRYNRFYGIFFRDVSVSKFIQDIVMDSMPADTHNNANFLLDLLSERQQAITATSCLEYCQISDIINHICCS